METLGVVRVVTDPDNETAEFAIVVRSDLKGQGFGAALAGQDDRLLPRSAAPAEIVGQVMANNHAMLGLAESRGFRQGRSDGPETVDVTLRLGE